MATKVERKVLGQGSHLSANGALLASLLKGLECSVSASNVVSVVLGVVQLHDLSGDVGLQRIVCVIEFGKSVDGHGVSFHQICHPTAPHKPASITGDP